MSSTTNTEPPILILAREAIENMSYRHFDFEANERAREGDKGSVILDVTTANIVVQVHDNLGAENQAKFATILSNNPQRGVEIALKMIAKAGK